MQIDIKVLGGLPVTIEYDWCDYDNSDIGQGGPGVDDWKIVAINGRYVKNAAWLEKRIMADEAELDRVLDACIADYRAWKNDSYKERDYYE